MHYFIIVVILILVFHVPCSSFSVIRVSSQDDAGITEEQYYCGITVLLYCLLQ